MYTPALLPPHPTKVALLTSSRNRHSPTGDPPTKQSQAHTSLEVPPTATPARTSTSKNRPREHPCTLRTRTGLRSQRISQTDSGSRENGAHAYTSVPWTINLVANPSATLDLSALSVLADLGSHLYTSPLHRAYSTVFSNHPSPRVGQISPALVLPTSYSPSRHIRTNATSFPRSNANSSRSPSAILLVTRSVTCSPVMAVSSKPPHIKYGCHLEIAVHATNIPSLSRYEWKLTLPKVWWELLRAPDGNARCSKQYGQRRRFTAIWQSSCWVPLGTEARSGWMEAMDFGEVASSERQTKVLRLVRSQPFSAWNRNRWAHMSSEGRRWKWVEDRIRSRSGTTCGLNTTGLRLWSALSVTQDCEDWRCIPCVRKQDIASSHHALIFAISLHIRQKTTVLYFGDGVSRCKEIALSGHVR